MIVTDRQTDHTTSSVTTGATSTYYCDAN